MLSWLSFQSWKLNETAGNAVAAQSHKAAYDVLQNWRWTTSVAELVIIFATVLLLSVYLKARVGKSWPVMGVAIVTVLMAAGFMVGFPR